MSDWNATRLGDCISVQGGYAFSSEFFQDSGIPLVRISNIVNQKIVDKSPIYLPSDFLELHGDYAASGNDSLIAMSGATTGKTALVMAKDLPFLINQRVGRFVIKDGDRIDSLFLFYLVNYEEVQTQVLIDAVGGAQPNISSNDIERIVLSLPPLAQQQKIAKILSTVDNLIEKTQALIDKYTSIKQGMMSDLFTRGIDLTAGSNYGKLRLSVEDAPELYKETELGWVPKEWEVVEIDEICTQMTNGFVGVATPFYANESEEGVRYLYGNNVRANKLELHKVLTIKSEFHEKLRKSQLKRGDMLTVQSGHIGTSAVVPDNFGEANCHALIITRFIQSRVIPEFVSYYLNSAIGMNRMEEIFVGSTIKHVNVKELKEFEIPLPSLEEQGRFISRIDQTLSLISAEEIQLDKLKNQKKGLMQDLLTGKVRV